MRDFIIENGVLLAYRGTKANVTIPDEVKVINMGAFLGNRYIESVTLSPNTENINGQAFYMCDKLKRVNIPNSDKLTFIGSEAFGRNNNLSVINGYIPHNCNVVGNFIDNSPKISEMKKEFEIKDGVLLKYNGSAETVAIPDSVREIAKGAFERNDTIKHVSIGNLVKKIGERAFAFCINLASVFLPKGVTIDKESFMGCKNLQQVHAPEVKEIKENAFKDCVRLNSFILPENSKISPTAFQGCPNMNVGVSKKVFEIENGVLVKYHGSNPNVNIPEGVTSIASGAFKDLDYITDIKLPSTVTKIESKAIENCSALKSINLLDNPNTSVEDSAFLNCQNLSSVGTAKNDNGIASEDELSKDSKGISITGHIGTWKVIDTRESGNSSVFLLENEQHGDNAFNIIVDSKANVKQENVENGFAEYDKFCKVETSQVSVSKGVEAER